MMRKLRESRLIVLATAVAGLIALALLTAALRELTFRPPVPFAFDLTVFYRIAYPGTSASIPSWKYFVFGSLILLVLSVIMFFLDPELRKKMFIKLVRFLVAMAVIWYVTNYVFDRNSLSNLLKLGPAGGGQTGPVTNGTVVPAYSVPQVNPWLVFAISFAIGLALVIFGWMVYARRMKMRALLARHEMAEIAREALDELQPGRNWDDAIVRAYVRMNQVVVAERGLTRQPGNTPSEFAQRMERIGLPGEAVRALTRLFEGVRYGGRVADQAERDLAAAALSAILHSLGRST